MRGPHRNVLASALRRRQMRVLLLLLLAAGPLMLGLGFQAAEDRGAYRGRLDGELRSAAQTGLNRFNDELRQVQAALADIAQLVDMGLLKRGPEDCARMLWTKLDAEFHHHLSNLLIVDEGGRALCSALPVPAGQTFEDRRWLEVARIKIGRAHV